MQKHISLIHPTLQCGPFPRAYGIFPSDFKRSIITNKYVLSVPCVLCCPNMRGGDEGALFLRKGLPHCEITLPLMCTAGAPYTPVPWEGTGASVLLQSQAPPDRESDGSFAHPHASFSLKCSFPFYFLSLTPLSSLLQIYSLVLNT